MRTRAEPGRLNLQTDADAGRKERRRELEQQVDREAMEADLEEKQAELDEEQEAWREQLEQEAEQREHEWFESQTETEPDWPPHEEWEMTPCVQCGERKLEPDADASICERCENEWLRQREEEADNNSP